MSKYLSSKKAFHWMGLLVLLLSACAGPTEMPTPVPSQPLAATASSIPTQTPRPTATATLTSSPTLTPAPSATATPTQVPAGTIPIVEYHDPDFKLNDQVQMTIPWFEDQIGWLASNGYRTLSGEELAAFLDGSQSFPEKSVVLSFDIGLPKREIYVNSVIPILQKYHFQAVFFILANSTVVEDECGKDSQHFCWDDFKQWADEGLITIASHGMYHPDFSTLNTAQIRYEVDTPRKLLQEKTGRVPVAFAFPFDTTTPTAISLVKAAGYAFAVAGNTRSVLAAAPNDPDRYHLPRVYPYSNQRMWPNLNGFNKPFGDVITSFTTPGVAVQPTTAVTQTPVADAGTNVEQVQQFCRALPSNTTLRLSEMVKSSFPSDLSPAAQAKLPGLSTTVSCNFLPGNKPDTIVLHYTVGDLDASVYSFRQANGTSAHYIIDRDGSVVQLVPEGLSALHASCTGNRLTCVASCPICDDSQGRLVEPYTRSIGIEIVNRGHVPSLTSVPNVYEDYLRSFAYPYWEDFTQAQIDSLKVLVEDIAQRWNIPIDNQHVIGHYRINQKVDPGPALNLFWTRSGNPSRPPIFDMTPTP